MEMDITLIVKASNQQFEDQTIKCEPTWTIRRLKGHLTEVYPGKPSTDEQKLIYSGQLLGDSVVLKDILRHYDGQEAHTVHLVFTPKNNRHTKDFGNTNKASSSTDQRKNSKTMSPKSNSSSDGTVTAVTAGSSSQSASGNAGRPAPSDSGASFGADGLRQRNVTAQSTGSTVGANPIPMATADYIMGQQLAMQNWMQQTYMQYLNQYMNVISGQTSPQALSTNVPTNNSAVATPQPNPMNLATTMPPPAVNFVNQNPLFAQTLPNLAYYPYLSTMSSSPMPSASSIPAPISSSGTIPTSSPHGLSTPTSQPPTIPATSPPGPSSSAPSTAVAGVQPAAPDQPMQTGTGTAQPAGANPEQAADAAPGAAVEAAAAAPPAAARRFPNIVVEEQENRDWLDIFFSMCRVGILMTVVYLYSSPIRCITVLFIGSMLYLYQIGFFRNNNAERIERARQIVVQQINNAHGARQNAILRARAAAAAAAAAPAPVPPAAGRDEQPATAETDSTESPKASSVDASENNSAPSSSSSSGSAKDASGSKQSDEVNPTESNSQQVEQSNVVPEANRINVNDVAAFVRTLVLSFFTSIIPDTPAA